MSEKLPSVPVELTLLEIGYLHANLDQQIKQARELVVSLTEKGCSSDPVRVDVINRHADRLEAIKMHLEEGTLGRYPGLIGRVFQ